ncbi:MAG: DNA-directed RNA polymerase subunit beta' [Clostridia bacterium]|nr:DNA-directed RNA polymerase subunit beta' [Clostridia bacterium]
MVEFNTFNSIKIGLASPEKIRAWSHGEVKKPETINYRTLKAERDGLYCEKIFGPQKDWECACGKYKRVRYKGIVCDRCGVEVTKAKVRRERMGHIELAAPVSHIWYFKGIPSRIGLFLDVSPRLLEKVLYFAAYMVVDPGRTELEKYQCLSEKEYHENREKYGDAFKAGMGAETIKELLEDIDIEQLSAELHEELEGAQGQKKARIVKRLEVIEAFRQTETVALAPGMSLGGRPLAKPVTDEVTGAVYPYNYVLNEDEINEICENGINEVTVYMNSPSWMIMTVLPVIPPEIRPMIQLDGGRFATSDLNDLYRRVINRNNRLKRLLELKAPEIIVRNEKRMLQEAVDALIDNGRRGRPVTGPGNRALKSLSDMLKGKQGRFRQNLLGKRVDYSGRSVIVVGPELKIYQCGLPKEMAIELFKPFVMKNLVEEGIAHNIKSAKRMVERVKPEVWDVLEDVIKEHPVLLNRAPTLHRLGIQAFEPILVEGRAIKLHPLACTAFNADFDGDQMAVHVPLSPEAQAEARFLMLSANNLLKPQDGKPVTVPTQDMVLGSYYLTMEREDELGAGKYFASPTEAMLAYENGDLEMHAPIKVKRVMDVVITDKNTGEEKTYVAEGFTDATIGRIIFNEKVPQDLGFVKRKAPIVDFANTDAAALEAEIAEILADSLKYEIVTLTGKSGLGKIINKCIKKHGASMTAVVLDDLKAMGYHYSTIGSISISVADMVVPEKKKEYLAEAEAQVDKIEMLFKMGQLSDDERYRHVIKAWEEANEKITKALMDNLDPYNSLFMMADSGARGSKNQIRQLAGMRGLMADTQGRTVEIPIRANFREGLNILEYFISSHGARKGLTDTALKTADSGYLTRRLVDVSQDVIIREEDCGTVDGITVSSIKDGNEMIESISSRLSGRVPTEDVVDPATGEILAKKNEIMTDDVAAAIENAEIPEVKVRSVLTCRAKIGVCAKCYGENLATSAPVNIGEAVGIIAAQSIGEPGTQLTMRTFHSGGVASNDITQGLPRIEELFEARKPKGLATITEIDGTVKLSETKQKREAIITNNETGESETYTIRYGVELKVKDGDEVKAGDALTKGPINPGDILRIKGKDAVHCYMIQEVQRVYRQQGVEISDKHVEVIVRQMMKKMRVEEAGDTGWLVGSMVERLDYILACEAAEKDGTNPPVCKDVLLGITKAALATDSFLSAASFQETTRVLTEAAIKGKSDPLLGLKENVIIGKLIPAGTGVDIYQNIELEHPIEMSDINYFA